MTTALATVTPHNAPRTVEGLSQLGIFRLRTLIKDLGGLENDQQCAAFANMKGPEKAAYALQLLVEFDKANGGPPNGVAAPRAPQAAPSAMQAPMVPQMPMVPNAAMAPPMGFGAPMGGPQVAAVDPAALAHAQAAAAAATAPTEAKKRTPKAPASAEDAGIGTQVLQLLNQTLQNQEQFTQMVRQSLSELGESVKGVGHQEQQLKNLHASYEGLYAVLKAHETSIQALRSHVALGISVMLIFAEQQLGASRNEVLQTAATDVPTVLAILNSSGK